MNPTLSFSPFGPEGPKVVLYGLPTGDWNSSCLQVPGDQNSCSGLYSRLSKVARGNLIESICIPSLVECNTKICEFGDFIYRIMNGAGSISIFRGAKGDGMLVPRGTSVGMPTADCPTIIAHAPGTPFLVVGHGGLKSLWDSEHFLTGCTPRESPSIVHSIMQTAKLMGVQASRIMVFITCGIAGYNYERRDLSEALKKKCQNEFQLERKCFIEDSISLHKLASERFKHFGVTQITFDDVDTLSDEVGGKLLWHSFRRDRSPGRNLVLVVNKK